MSEDNKVGGLTRVSIGDSAKWITDKTHPYPIPEPVASLNAGAPLPPPDIGLLP